MMLERLQKLGRRERIGLSMAGVLLGLWLLDRFVAVPVVRAVRELDAAIEEQERQVAYNRGIIRQAERISETYSAVEGWVERKTSSSVAIGALKERVDEMATTAGLTIGSMKDSAPRAAAHTETYIVEIGNFESTVPDLVRFLRDMAAVQEATRVSRLTLESDPESRRVRGSMVIAKTVLRAGA